MISQLRSVGKTKYSNAIGMVKDLSTPQKSFKTIMTAAILGDLDTLKACIDPETQDKMLQKLLKGEAKFNLEYASKAYVNKMLEQTDDFAKLEIKVRDASRRDEFTYHKHGSDWLLLLALPGQGNNVNNNELLMNFCAPSN